MVLGNGVKVNGKVVNEINRVIDLTEETSIQFGKNKFIRITR